MTDQSVAPEIDIFSLPVFADANIWSMWPADKLNELADDIKDNGFDHRYPLTIAEINGAWMLLDGRNRREAAKIAGIVPPVIVTTVDPKLAVHRSNNQNRDATPGQKAMAFAMAWPDAINKGGRGKTSILEIEVSKPQITRARYVLRNNPVSEGCDYPDRCLAIMAGTQTLTEAYELTQADVKRREAEEALRQENAAKLTAIRGRFPDLAALVDDERLSLTDAIASAESREREAAEKARRAQEEEDRKRKLEEEKLKEEERQELERKRQEQANYEANRAAFHYTLHQLLQGSVLVSNPASRKDSNKWKGSWTAFYRKYEISIQEARQRLTELSEHIPFILETLESMRDE